VKFSQKFSGKEIEERWKAMLYDPTISREAAKGMISLPTNANKRVLWTVEEEQILKKEVMKFHPTMETFPQNISHPPKIFPPMTNSHILYKANSPHFVSYQQILEHYRDYFHSSRTAKSLEAHFYRMKRTGGLATAAPPAEVKTEKLEKPPGIEILISR
jgi:hypothetical protein